jgi:hypothetical protein
MATSQIIYGSLSATTYQNLPDNVTGKYLPLSGGTVTGQTFFTSGVSITGSVETSGSQVYHITDDFIVENPTINGSLLEARISGGVNIWSLNSNISIDAENRILYDSVAGGWSIDWENRQLIKSDGTTVSFDWENGILTGQTNIESSTISATTISATTLYGDGSNLTGVSGGGSFTGGTVTGSTTFTNTVSADTISATTLYVGGNSIAQPYKVYTALISQTGTDVPTTDVILENTLGYVPLLSRGVTGIYQIEATASTLTQIYTIIGNNRNIPNLDIASLPTGGPPPYKVSVYTFSGGTLTDGLLNKTPIEIRIYN